jgi:molybdenum cofactor biosynthesis protein B
MNTIVSEHRRQAPQCVRCGVITVSDTRTLETDVGGQTIVELLTAAGHTVAERTILPDDPELLATNVVQLVVRADAVDCLLVTGGTGISARDQTTEAVSGLLTKTLPGFGELFRWLSYQEIGPAAMLSRAIGGIRNRTVIFTMPGSPAGVRLAMEKLILPELGHLVREARR